jgi:hypothetical protein
MVVRTVCHSAGRSVALRGETMAGSSGRTKVDLWDMMRAAALAVKMVQTMVQSMVVGLELTSVVQTAETMDLR